MEAVRNQVKKIIKKLESSRQAAETVNPKTILLLGLGMHVRGNLQYLLDVLNADPSFDGWKIYVRTTKDTDADVCALISENHWMRTSTVASSSQYDELMETAGFLLTETYFPEKWVKQPGQICINIWHGTPIKKIGPAKNFKNCHRNGDSQKNFINADYLLYPNDYTKETMTKAYRIGPLLSGQALMLGYPRTGGMLSVTEEEAALLRRDLAGEQGKIYAYMPTYRGIVTTQEEESAQIRDFLAYMDAHLSDREILYVNLHHKMALTVSYDGYTHVRPFPKEMDTYRLLAASDALITDYSSVMFDYLALRRQIVLYVPDYETYRKKRGLFMDLEGLPFDRTATPGETYEALQRGKTYDDEDAYAAYCAYDSPDNAKKLCRLFLGDESGLTLEAFPKSSRPNILIHTEMAPVGAATDLLYQLYDHRKEAAGNLFFSCRDQMTAKESGAYPLFRKCPVIGSGLHTHLDEAGEKAKKEYLDGSLPFAQAMEVLGPQYALMLKRMVGDAPLSLLLIYDCTDPERILGLAESGIPYLLFLQGEMLDQIEAGDPFLFDALSHAAEKSRGNFVLSSTDLTRAKTIPGTKHFTNVRVVDTAASFLKVLKEKM